MAMSLLSFSAPPVTGRLTAGRALPSARPSSSPSSSSSSTQSLLHTSFLSSSSISFPSTSSGFSGLSMGVNFSTERSVVEKRRGLVVRAAKKYQLCQTKRNRSRKSLARTHGFRRRMRTTSGRAILRRRRAKGRKILCTKTNPNSGKRS